MLNYIYTILVILGGFILIILDIMIIPGGLVGTLGAILIVATIHNGYKLLGAGFALNVSIITTIIALIIAYTTIKFKLWRVVSHQESASGYTPFAGGMKELIDQEGETITPLRPAGMIKIGEKRYNAMSNGEMIETKSKVKVIGVSGGQLVVKSGSQ